MTDSKTPAASPDAALDAGSPEGVMARLREGTRELHNALEALPFSGSLQEGRLDLERYLAFLRSMAFLHEAVEEAAAESCDPSVAGVWTRELARLPALREDLDALAPPGGHPPVRRPELLAILGGEEARLHGGRTPAALLGWLYVLQGSALGGRTVAGPVARGLALSAGRGTAFLQGKGAPPPGPRWQAFSRRMEEVLQDPADGEAALRGAREAFQAVHAVFQALEPAFGGGQGGHLTPTLNREAGLHRIPQDPLEIRAALRAGAASWERFPYYEHRYGARGRRFTRSDSAWIVTLAGEPLEVVEHQLRWLGRFLAVRGMPRWLLECHVEALHRELVAAHPARRREYAVLLEGITPLEEERLRVLDAAAVEELAAAFRAEIPAAEGKALPWAAHILAAAVADEGVGITGALRSVEGWMRDRSRFSDPWVQAVRGLLDGARSRATPLPGGPASSGAPPPPSGPPGEGDVHA